MKQKSKVQGENIAFERMHTLMQSKPHSPIRRGTVDKAIWEYSGKPKSVLKINPVACRASHNLSKSSVKQS